jgi:hypothetical protein
MANVIRGRRLSRRTFLRGASALIALPVLDAMTPALARVTAGPRAPAQPLRSVFLYAPNGQKMDAWTPKEKGSGFTLPPLLEPLADLRRDFSILSGLALDGANAHGDGPGDHARASAAFLTGTHPKKTGGADLRCGVSIDQMIAAKIGGATMLPSLELGTEGGKLSGNCDSGYSCAYVNCISWRSETQPVPKETNPREVFSRLFGDVDRAQDAAAEARRRRMRGSILDAVREDARRVRSSLAPADRAKLDEYLTSVRELEARLERAERETKTVAAPKEVLAAGQGDPFEIRMTQMIELVALAFQGDLVRTVTFMLANDGTNRAYPNLDIADGHHDVSHHGGDADKLAKVGKINVFYMAQVGKLLRRLRATTEGDSTLLDASFVVYGSGIADGDAHNHDNLPILVAGGAGRKLRHGKHVTYPARTPLAGLYLAMLPWYEIEARSFGDAQAPLAF